MTKQVIITGDDFGIAVSVNEAIEEAYRRGVLTTTSLLIGEPAAADAVERARRNPGMRVGLHVAVCESHPVLAPADIPDLVNARGELSYHPVLAAFRFLRARVRRQLEGEIRAQFRAFRATGLELDHVNGHNHMQLHPVILSLLVKVAREFGVQGVRLSYEPLVASWRAARRGLALRIAAWLAMRPWCAYVKRRLVREGFRVNDYLFGIYDSGEVDLDLFIGFLRNLPDGVSEIHCHPATRRCAEIDRTMPRYHHEDELRALTSPAVRAALAAAGARPLAGFSALSAQ